MKRILIVPDGWPCTLEECPPGLFMYEGYLNFKTEYRKQREDGAWKLEAYCDSGETFCRPDETLVQPVVYVEEEYEE